MSDVVENMSGTEKAALLLMTLGEREAAEVLKFMEANEVHQLGSAMASLKSVSRNDADQILDIFILDVEDQTALGVERSSGLIEGALAAVAKGLKKAGVRRLIVAGGETSGAAVGALGVRGLRIGPQIDPGVPWTASLESDPMALALKSGNFGSPRFFLDAFDKLP